MKLNLLLQNVEKYYADKVATHGCTARGADWKSEDSQRMRFEQLLRLIRPAGSFTINDYGCGYGALADYLRSENFPFRYRGFDISEEMIARARRAHEGKTRCEFFSEKSLLSPADYSVASGIFNVKLDTPEPEWREYVLETLGEFKELSRKAFAFNALTSYSDPEFMRPDLYYANPLELFDYCRKNLSRKVALLHDYPLYEFTIVVQTA
jgi:SAM-dependent methyltransferase